MGIDRILFGVGFVLLIIGFMATQIIWLTMSQELRTLWFEQIGILGDLLWIPLIIGIILTDLGYWKKPKT